MLYILSLSLNVVLGASIVPIIITKDNTCGIYTNNITVCDSNGPGPCCSMYGWCGSTIDYCGSGCILNCTKTTTTTKASSTKTTTKTRTKASSTKTTTKTRTKASSTTTTRASPTNVISIDGTCGGNVICPNNNCCSMDGWCGTDEQHCSVALGCQSQCTFIQSHQLYQWCTDGSKKLTLTFDDGPSNYTNDVAVYLNSVGIKATFFMIGENIQMYPSIVQNVYNLGHTIGVHTWSHPFMATLDNKTILSELTQTINLITKLTGEIPKYWRPPYSNYTNTVLELAYSVGLNTVLFNVDSGDWIDSDASFVEPIILGNLTIGSINGGILQILHDIHPKVLELTEYTNTIANNLGYNFVDLQTCIGV